MILILVPVVAAMLGVGLWVGLRGLTRLNVLGAEPAYGPVARESRSRPRGTGTTLRERAEEIPYGCLMAVVIASGVWMVGWLVLLIVGLSLLS